MYRRAQRELENEKVYFDQKLSDYQESKEPKKLLAERTAKIAMGVHEKWEGLVPDALGLQKAAKVLNDESN